MAGSTCQPDLGNAEHSVPRHREWTTALERDTIPSELLELSPEVSMWLRQHVAQGNFVDDPARNSPLTPAAL